MRRIALLVVLLAGAGVGFVSCQTGVTMWSACTPSANGNPWGTDGQYVLRCEGGEWVPKMTAAEFAELARGGHPTIAPLPSRPTMTTSTTSTTTIPPVADLVPSISGPTAFAQGQPNLYTATITNTGTAPTAGGMSFTVQLDLITGNGVLTVSPAAASGWAFTGSGPGFGFASDPGTVLAPGASATMTMDIQWGPAVPGDGGSIRLQTTLPGGIGGETNSANNSDSLTVTIPSA
jgi:hypothetical protein